MRNERIQRERDRSRYISHKRQVIEDRILIGASVLIMAFCWWVIFVLK